MVKLKSGGGGMLEALWLAIALSLETPGVAILNVELLFTEEVVGARGS